MTVNKRKRHKTNKNQVSVTISLTGTLPGLWEGSEFFNEVLALSKKWGVQMDGGYADSGVRYEQKD